MLNDQKQLNLLGLATKAGKLVSGEETVLSDVKKRQVKLVIVAIDCSDSTKKKMADKCNFYKVPCIQQFTTEQISYSIGKKRSIVAFADSGFANSFQKLIDNNTIKQ